jgi:hypothetical protein
MYCAARNSSAVALPRPRISSLARPFMYFRTESSVTEVFDLGACPCVSAEGTANEASAEKKTTNNQRCMFLIFIWRPLR